MKKALLPKISLVVDPGEGLLGGGRAPHLFLDQTEAWRAEKIFFDTGFPPLSQGLGDQVTATALSATAAC